MPVVCIILQKLQIALNKYFGVLVSPDRVGNIRGWRRVRIIEIDDQPLQFITAGTQHTVVQRFSKLDLFDR
jgi:hypothetical protein